MSALTVSQISEFIEHKFGVRVPPKAITDLIYLRRIDIKTTLVAGRRFIESSDVPAVLYALRRAGKLQGVDFTAISATDVA